MIIGLCGKMGAGKDTAGAYLVEHYGFTRISFADKLKMSAAACFGIDKSKWEDWKSDPMKSVVICDLENEDPIVLVTVREFLQYYGTEAHRNIFGQDFWVEQAIKDIDLDKDYVVTDVRFDNEAIAVHELGGMILQIHRNGDTKDAHPSEVGISSSLIDGKIANHGSKSQLYILLDALLGTTSEE